MDESAPQATRPGSKNTAWMSFPSRLATASVEAVCCRIVAGSESHNDGMTETSTSGMTMYA